MSYIDEFKNMQIIEKHRDNLGIDVNKKIYTMLEMGRIEQKKGLLLLLHAHIRILLRKMMNGKF